MYIVRFEANGDVLEGNLDTVRVYKNFTSGKHFQISTLFSGIMI